ncbi:hypothetical protein [Vulgatibacter incomptus]|uniref:TolA protein n=1 Tax=Vulgatibacter incomptus TaxID=1391653 RepID=A0A0K1PFN1_9BACT|nr:hypothetical protein [Vulgatibacter incomptus]AKU92216.1 TolA protein [Vulgatibacter incomptus]
MKRAFDSNVSRAKPRTRLLDALAPEPEESSISPDLAALIARPRASLPDRRPAEGAKAAAATAVLAGAVAAEVSATRAPAPARRDGLVEVEAKLADQASQVAHEASRARGGLPAHMARAAASAQQPAAPSRPVESMPATTPAPQPRAEAARSSASTTAHARERFERPSADLAATVREELRSAARPMVQQAAETKAAPSVPTGLSADLAQTVSRAHAGRTRIPAPAAETVREGRARIEELRGRLMAAQEPKPAPLLPPGGAAAAVRNAVTDLRARLAAAVSERDTIAKTLEATRDDLRRVSQELTERTKALAAAETVAAERARVAEELVAEAEALAEERDQALSRILELKSLDEQQLRLLADAERALAERDQRLERGAYEATELLGLVDAQAIELEELQARLMERTTERDAALGRAAGLEADLERHRGTSEALAELQRLVASESNG